MADERPILISCSRPGAAYNVIIGDRIVVGGWALAPAGVERVDAILVGHEPDRLAFPAPDAPADMRSRYPGYPDAADCGFAGVVPVNGAADGRTTLAIRVTGRDGQTAELPVPIEIDRGALASGRLLALVDRPIPPPGRAVLDEGHLGVRGWALSGAGIDRVEAIVGGEARGRIRLGMLRPDVPRAYPDIPGVEHCGFVGLIPVTDLAPGVHRVLIRVIGGNDAQVEIEREFEVAAPRTIFGQAPRANAQYAEWLRRHEPTADDIARAQADAASIAPRTTFSLMLPAANDADIERIAATMKSLREQAYPHWEALVVVDAQTAPRAADAIAERAREDGRIRRLALTPRPSPIAMGEGSMHEAADANRVPSPAAAREGSGVRAFVANTALHAADGDFIIVLGPGDRLSPLALSELAAQAARTPDADLIYADEDKIGPDGARWDPFFKPDWAPDLLHSLDYIGPFAAIRRDAAVAIGGFRDDFPDAERYDLTLRVADRAGDPDGRIVHLPRLLFSRYRTSPVDPDTRDPAAEGAARRAVAASLARQGIEAEVEPGLIPGARRVRRALRERPPVTLLVPTGGKLHYLRPCLDSLLSATTYPDIRLLVIDNSDGDEVAALCNDMARDGVRIQREPFPETPFNFSAVINHALRHVETPYVVLLNDDMTVVTPDWIEAMLEHAQRPDVGAVGAKLLYPDDTLQHAGVIFGPYGGSTHPFRHVPPTHPGYFGFPHVVREWSAVTFACAMLRTATFAEIGPLDETNFRVAFNDADVCLRLRERGYRIVYTPHAVLHHYESATKKLLAEPGEVEYMRRRWDHVIDHDPYYNPNLTRTGEDFSLDMG